MKYTNIPYRRWRKQRFGTGHELVENSGYKRVMKRMGDALDAGKAVTMDHVIVNPLPVANKPYDTVSITIED